MIHFCINDIDSMNYLHRINLVNSCTGFKSANLIGTKSNTGITNVAIFSSVTHIGSNPPLLGFFLRPTTVIRNTYENLKETGEFTLNHIHQDIITDAHHTSAKYDKDISEFDKTGLEEEYKNGFYAPFVKNAPVQLAIKYIDEHPISANNTILVVGQISDVYVKDELLNSDGYIDLTKGKVAAINGLDGYTIPVLKKRLEYQRPKQERAKNK